MAIFANKIYSRWNGLSWDDISFLPESHLHDDRYYTESEITTALAGKISLSGNYQNEMTGDLYLGGNDVRNITNIVPNVTNGLYVGDYDGDGAWMFVNTNTIKFGNLNGGTIHANGLRLTNLAAPIDGTDAATATWVLGLFDQPVVEFSYGIMVNNDIDLYGDLLLEGGFITGVPTPTLSGHAANKQYVDDSIPDKVTVTQLGYASSNTTVSIAPSNGGDSMLYIKVTVYGDLETRVVRLSDIPASLYYLAVYRGSTKWCDIRRSSTNDSITIYNLVTYGAVTILEMKTG